MVSSVGARFPHERLVLVLIALSTLLVINPRNVQDVTRLGLTRSIIERGSLNIDPWAHMTTDRAFRAGHWYSDKAPGVSFVAIPPLAVMLGVDRVLPNPDKKTFWDRQSHMWLLRMITSGIPLLVAAWLVGRVAERLRPGYGALVAITFAVGTMAGPLGATTFEQDGAMALGFSSFYLVARSPRLAVAAGALSGAAVLFEYQAVLVALAVAVYIGWRYGVRRLLEFGLGGAPAAVVLGAYDWAAFGSPFHLSYKYVANEYTERQHHGFFGIGTPTLHGVWYLFLDGKGLLLVSPVLVAAAAGLVALWRRGVRAEAALYIAITLIFLFADMGYFEPYGGTSPGPRFFAPALPFLALGLVEAYRRWPVPTSLLALWSFSWTTLDGITWAILNKLKLKWDPNTVWGRLPVIKLHMGLELVYVGVAMTVAYAAFLLLEARSMERGAVEDERVGVAWVPARQAGR